MQQQFNNINMTRFPLT